MLDSARKVVHGFLNRPGIQQMRELDQNFYVVLTIQSFKRGLPLLPVRSANGEDVTRIDAGHSMGLTSWIRYDPAMLGSQSFYLSEYLTLFAESIGQSLKAYQTLDGQELLYFQCAVRYKDWSRVREHVRNAYLLQKTAYRRANGGAQAPGLVEATAPKFCQEDVLSALADRIRATEEAQRQQKIQVRNTFIEQSEDSGTDDEDDDQLARRNGCRHRTAMHLRMSRCVRA
ncbi:Slc9a8 [Symbiodinium natans]|uniref:Slc9a8 protein n=1 Tax=Symbiodinium natans TaxID=878477 RepID=A0A812TVX0_9DINO|nr:Slc9a8 [Symbiodinium natans]